MQTGFKKGLKPSIIKYMAILMGICYLLSPVHQHLITVFHTLSHELELPNFVIAHSSFSDHHEVHGHHHMDTEELPHEHKFLDLVNSIFETPQEDGQAGNSLLFTIKLCIPPDGMGDLKSKILIVEANNNYNMNSKNTKKGFVIKSLKPPLIFIGQSS